MKGKIVMPNKAIFTSLRGMFAKADTFNEAGAAAYGFCPEAALAQYAVTGTFNDIFYASGKAQLDVIARLAAEVEDEFLASLAIYAAETAYMKDMPLALLAILSSRRPDLFARAFPRVVKGGKMLRGFVGMMRSGALGRKSLGTRPKRMVVGWLEDASDADILNAYVGNDPSLGDVIKMVHPKPKDETRAALFAWVMGKPHDHGALPGAVKDFELFKRDMSRNLPDVPFQMLTSLPLTKEHWIDIAKRSSWQMLRQNINTFARNGCFDVEGFGDWLAMRLSDPEAVRAARMFPYQLMAAHRMACANVPDAVRRALEAAMKVGIETLPAIRGNVVVCPDVSGSMSSSITGYRAGASSKVRCIDVAALVTAAFLRVNPAARLMPFDCEVVDVRINPRDTVMTNAEKLAAIGGGGTTLSAPLLKLKEEKAKVDLVVIVSDNQSWMDGAYTVHTDAMAAWGEIKKHNPNARLVCLDIQPYANSQVKGGKDILNIGGFSDSVFTRIADFAKGREGSDHLIDAIKAVTL